MRKDYSAPVVTARPARATQKSSQQQAEEKQVDYTGLDILEQVERVIDEKLYTHHYVRTSQKWQCKCPFPNCTSTTDSFLLWTGREVLEEGQMHYHCTHCRRKGDLINFYRQYREVTTGERPDWKEAARFFGINTRTWKVDGQGEQESEGATKRRQQAERQHKAEQAEMEMLDAIYRRARAWLAAGHITMKDGRRIELETARAYLQERGFTLDQASALGIAYIPTAKEFPEIAEDKKIAPWRGRILFPLAGARSASGYAGRSLWKWAPGMPAEQHKRLLDAWNERYRDDWTKQVQRYYKTRQAAYYGYEEVCRDSTLVIVEGEFDAASVRLALADTPDIAVCAFGKNFQARLVPLNVLHIILALDGDQAGQEAIARQVDELESRGVTVAIVRPPAGKDWNECHQLAGLGAIRAAIAGQGEQKARESAMLCDAIPESATQRDAIPEQQAAEQELDWNQCVICHDHVEDREDAFHMDENPASAYYGDLFCSACWARQREQQREVDDIELTENPQSEQADLSGALARIREIFEGEINGEPVWPDPYTLTLLPAGMSSAEYIERYTTGERPGRVIIGDQCELAHGDKQQSEHHCSKHGKLLAYSDELGGRYCSHVDCWERYRLIRAGARRGYTALVEVNKHYMHLPDTSKEPLYYIDVPGTQEHLPVYPNRSPVETILIAAGADAWRCYVSERGYQDIDQAVKALASA